MSRVQLEELHGQLKKLEENMLTREDIESRLNDVGISSEVDKFKSITKEMVELYEIKNRNYGDSFSRQFKEYGLTSVCIRLEDKLNRLKSLNKQILEAKNGIIDVNVDDENIKDTLIDLANYSVMTIMEIKRIEEKEE